MYIYIYIHIERERERERRERERDVMRCQFFLVEITNQWGFNSQNMWEVITKQPGIGSGCNLWLTSDKSYTRI